MAQTFKPTLGKILEESNTSNLDESSQIEDSVLDEYDVLSEHDLLRALDIHDDGNCLECTNSVKTDEDAYSVSSHVEDNKSKIFTDFESLHQEAKTKNQFLLEKYATNPEIDLNSKETKEVRKRNSVSIIDSFSMNSNDIVDLQPKSTLEPIKLCEHKSIDDNKHCLVMNSPAGRKLFKNAINQKYMAIYYIVSEQHVSYLSNNHGLATLNLVLDLLGTHHKSYIPAENSICFDDFACIARENGVSVDVVRVSKNSIIEDFRMAIKTSTASENSFVVCYLRLEELQCTGHFLTICGFFKDKDFVMIMEPNSHTRWMLVKDLWNLMQPKSFETLNSFEASGYLLLTNSKDSPSITLSINHKASIKLEHSATNFIPRKLLELKNEWNTWLSLNTTSPGNQNGCLLEGVQCIIEMIKKESFTTNITNPNLSADKTKLRYKQGSLVDSVTKTKLFPIVQDCIGSSSEEDLIKITQFAEWILDVLFITRELKLEKKFTGKRLKRKKKNLVKACVNVNLFNNAAMLTTWLLFWPYKLDDGEQDVESTTNSKSLHEFVKTDLDNFPKAIILLFHGQIKFVLKALQYTVAVRNDGMISTD